MNAIAASVLLAALAAGCASAPAEDANAWKGRLASLGLQPGAAVESIPHFRLDGFNALDASHLVLYSGVNRRYLVTLGTPCSGLTWAKRLAYTTSGGSLTRLDQLSVIDGRFEMRCMIELMQVLDKPQG